jgi:hypothetical protein
VTAVRDSNGRFRPAGSLTLNHAKVPGGVEADPLEEPFEAAGLIWEPEDAGRLCTPVGYALAVEWREQHKDKDEQ